MTSSGQRGRKLRNIIYDQTICCPDCEHKFLEPLDDYAIKQLRDKQNATYHSINVSEAAMGFYLFKNTDRQKLLQFIASLLWRCSVSTQLEIKDFYIGTDLENRIAQDLFHGQPIRYLDAQINYQETGGIDYFIAPWKQQSQFNTSDAWHLQMLDLRINIQRTPMQLPVPTVQITDPKWGDLQPPITLCHHLLSPAPFCYWLALKVSENERTQAVVQQLRMRL